MRTASLTLPDERSRLVESASIDGLPERELQTLAIHGILHLLGYRDQHKKDYVKMWKKTYQLLEEVGG